MEQYTNEAGEFVEDDVKGIIQGAIQAVLHEAQYNNKKVNEWTNAIVTQCLKELQALARPFKYIITCIITQKNGGGLNTSNSMFWDASKDGFTKVPWQNATMYCVVTIYGVCVNIDDPQDME